MDMQRRQFFRHLTGKTTDTAVKHLEARVNDNAKHWVRPPFAINELEFLLKCTRCGECVTACPHHIIFTLPARHGADVLGTPALDLLNKGCHLCEDTPCVSACQPRVLFRPADASPRHIRIAFAQLDISVCLPYQGPECGACASACTVDNALTFENDKPRIHPDHCTGCARCREACVTEPKAINISSVYAHTDKLDASLHSISTRKNI